MSEPDLRLRISGEAEITHAVLEARNYARVVGFDAVGTNMIATAISELAQNIRKYAGRGEVVVRHAIVGGHSGVEIVASDQGPGIENLEQALQDSFSSSGTLGLGLPGVRRLMDEFDIETNPHQGTRVTVRKWL